LSIETNFKKMRNGAVTLADPGEYPRLKAYVTGVVGAFARDSRVLGWDIWNEPTTAGYGAGNWPGAEAAHKDRLVQALLPKAFEWARAANPLQPLTSGVWTFGASAQDQWPRIAQIQIAQSDILTFHTYDAPNEVRRRILSLQRYHRPIICTEYMARSNGSTFQNTMPILKEYRVGAINWGLVAGKTQTYFPWDSWEKPYLTEEPTLWFHDVFRSDGRPYDPEEVKFIRAIIKATVASVAQAAPAPDPRNVPFRNTGGARRSNDQRGQASAVEVQMRFKNPGERSVHRQVAALTAAVAVLTCASAWANPQSDASAGSGRESAVWAPKELNFVYQGFTTKYSCDGLQDKMRNVLIKLGARHDIQVRSWGCAQLAGPDPLLPGVSIKMNVLQPAGKQGGEAVPAHWKMVDLLADRDPVDAAGDCELIEQIKQKVLPVFATRNVDYSSTCARHQLLIGATRLKAEVLVADQSAAADFTAR